MCSRNEGAIGGAGGDSKEEAEATMEDACGRVGVFQSIKSIPRLRPSNSDSDSDSDSYSASGLMGQGSFRATSLLTVTLPRYVQVMLCSARTTIY